MFHKSKAHRGGTQELYKRMPKRRKEDKENIKTAKNPRNPKQTHKTPTQNNPPPNTATAKKTHKNPLTHKDNTKPKTRRGLQCYRSQMHLPIAIDGF
jgi:hypothetical protein